MGLVTSVLWLFYFIIGFTWPSYVKRFKPFGAFMWYCVWYIIGLVLIYLCVNGALFGTTLLTLSVQLRPGNQRKRAGRLGRNIQHLDQGFRWLP